MSLATSARSSRIAVALALLGAPAAAQLCTGLPFEGGQVQAFGRAATIQGERSVGGGLAFGAPAAFARLGAARTSAWNWERPGLEFRAAGGLAYPGGPRHAARFCVVGSLALGTGPHDVQLLDASGSRRRMDLSAMEWSLGVAAGSARPAIRRPLVYPTGSFVIVGVTERTRDRFSGVIERDRRTYGLIEGGFGIVFGGTFSIRPMIVIPVGLLSPRYGGSLTFAGTLGRRGMRSRF